MSLLNDRAGPWTREFAGRIRADRRTVFNLLAEMELWPALFPHIRSARVVRRDGNRRLVVVRASWHGVPIGWTAIETLDEAEGRITLRHVSRLTRGSIAIWSVGPTMTLDDGGPAVDVSVDQEVTVPLPLIGGLLARRFVGGGVARGFGQAILDRVRQVAEGGSLAGRD